MSVILTSAVSGTKLLGRGGGAARVRLQMSGGVRSDVSHWDVPVLPLCSPHKSFCHCDPQFSEELHLPPKLKVLEITLYLSPTSVTYRAHLIITNSHSSGTYWGSAAYLALCWVGWRIDILLVEERVCGCSASQSCPTLCDPMDCSQPGSSVHGILQARILERVAMLSSRGISPTQ